jgi:hypothetical protein
VAGGAVKKAQAAPKMSAAATAAMEAAAEAAEAAAQAVVDGVLEAVQKEGTPAPETEVVAEALVLLDTPEVRAWGLG